MKNKPKRTIWIFVLLSLVLCCGLGALRSPAARAFSVAALHTAHTRVAGFPCGFASLTLFFQCGGGDGGCGTGDPNDNEIQPVCSPIILDLSGAGFSLTSAQNGVLFDIAGTGHPIHIAWTTPGADNAFLCLPDSGGKCDDGKDLFGNFTPQPQSPHPNGFAALAVYDQPANGGNGDGIIDARDKIFSSLRLWVDSNHDGICQPGELFTLPSQGVNSISLSYHLSMKRDQFGNLFRYRARVNPDGSPDDSDVGRTAFDVFLTTAN
jgi:hypothetical protein